MARAYVLTGFPWALVPYFWLPVPVIQWVSVVGPHGLTLMTLAAAALCALALRPGGARAGLAGLVLLAVLFGGGVLLTPAAQDLAARPVVRLVQPNAPQHEKWDPQKIPVFMQRKLDFTRAAPAEGGAAPALIVWPETSVPSLLNRAGPTLDRITEAAGDTPVLLGIQRADQAGYYNSLIVLAPGGGVQALYDKHHLVPFGEYMPAAALFARWEYRRTGRPGRGGLHARAGAAGDRHGPPRERAAVDLLRGRLSAGCERRAAKARHADSDHQRCLVRHLVGALPAPGPGPYPPVPLNRGCRCCGRPTPGSRAVIDGAGRVLATIPLGEAGFADAPLPPPLRHTFYSRSGDLPAALLIFVAIASLWAGRRRRRTAETD